VEGNPQPVDSTETDRIQAIIEAAERAAAGIIRDAEAQARRFLEESRERVRSVAEERARSIAETTDALLARAEVLKRHSDELIRALERAEDPPRAERASHLKPVESPPPDEEPAAVAPPERPPQDVYAERRRSPGEIPTAGARLLATQMAVAGSSRAEIEQRLSSDFGVEDAEEMLNGILGPER
jgi:hypothetical protein